MSSLLQVAYITVHVNCFHCALRGRTHLLASAVNVCVGSYCWMTAKGFNEELMFLFIKLQFIFCFRADILLFPL